MNRLVRLRKAMYTDLHLLNLWDKQQHVIDSDPNDDWNWEVELRRDPPWRKMYIAELKSQPIGFVQIIDPQQEETHYWGDIGPNYRAIDIWIGEKAYLGHGYGTQMMNQALEISFDDETVNAVLVDPLSTNKRAIKFYQKLGFEFKERRRFGNDLCDVYELKRDIIH